MMRKEEKRVENIIEKIERASECFISVMSLQQLKRQNKY